MDNLNHPRIAANLVAVLNKIRMSVEIFKISGQTRRFTLCEKPSLVLGPDISSLHWTKLGIPRPGELCHLGISYRASSVFTVNITVDRLPAGT